jgi:hypothetical protein
LTIVDVEEIQSTRSEKLLAVVLTVFLLIGAGWAYVKIDDYARRAVDNPPPLSAAQRAAIDKLLRARSNYARASGQKRRALENLNVRREQYRTALDAGRPPGLLDDRYRAAQAAYDAAVQRQRRALAAVTAAQPAADAASRAEAKRFDDVQRKRELLAFGARLAYLIALIAVAYWLLARLRKRGSRYLPLAMAVVGTASLLALVFASDYITDYIDPLDLGPLVLSLFGIGATIAAFAALQRYLARRIPVRRVRKSECPFCGFPVRGAGPHCENCGREVVAACATCEAPRRVGTPRCATCGNV